VAAEPPNIITNVATTDATVPDSAMTEPIHRTLAARGLLPGERYIDSGYPSAELVLTSLRDFGIALISPVLLDTSPQARAGAGFDPTASPSTGTQARPPVRKGPSVPRGAPASSAAPTRSW
jgi:hypothetical protein